MACVRSDCSTFHATSSSLSCRPRRANASARNDSTAAAISLCSTLAVGLPNTSTIAGKPPNAMIFAASLDRWAIPNSISNAGVDPLSIFRTASSKSGTFAAADSDKLSFRLASSGAVVIRVDAGD
ncbi:hypothetical protein, variant 3 [Aphanomyces invadans]|uniref:Uncharacterized protein n=1 Tax=Aphanomyces invadans TaxID=157072 RepID=A0A024UUC5_9STRA|nr:hypothetical protein, variant 3 [Aphanomyces invadans]ETW09919.1 hypothetical protein, variant 3 [Aphanomyces invadans]|eukprot:XP_008861328.1 hypothetical protein, variant 3 [Aphanomyces invadans]